jgi:hypothetical protein
MLDIWELVRLVLVSTATGAGSDVISGTRGVTKRDTSSLGMRDGIGQFQLEACVRAAPVGDNSGLCDELFPEGPPAFDGFGIQMMSPFCAELSPALSWPWEIEAWTHVGERPSQSLELI